MAKRYLMVLILCLAALSAFLFLLNWVFQAQQHLTYYDEHSYQPNGLKALTLLVRQAGFQLTSVNTLPVGQTATVILLSTGKIPAAQRRKVLQWVKRGGTLWELTPFQPGLIPRATGNELIFLPEGKAFTADLPSLTEIRYLPQSNPVITAQKPDEGYFHYRKHYFCYRIRYGRGSVISWNDLNGLVNIHVKDHPDNAVAFVALLTRIAPSRSLAFYNMTQSQFHFHWKTSLATFFERYGSACILGLVAIGLFLWKKAARFGRPRPFILARGRSYHEFLVSMADLFQQAGIKQVVLINLWRSLWRVILDITGLPADTPVATAVEKLSDITGRNYAAIILLHSRFDSDAAAPLLETARALDQHRRELMQWKTSRIW